MPVEISPPSESESSEESGSESDLASGDEEDNASQQHATSDNEEITFEDFVSNFSEYANAGSEPRVTFGAHRGRVGDIDLDVDAFEVVGSPTDFAAKLGTCGFLAYSTFSR